MKLNYILNISISLLCISTHAMTCEDLFKTEDRISTLEHESPFPYDDKSAVDRLGLAELRNSEDPKVQKWQAEQNHRSVEFWTLDQDKNPHLKVISDRAAELVATNTPPAVETASGSIYLKAGGLFLKELSGNEVALAPKIVYPNGAGVEVAFEFKLSPDEKYVAYSYAKNGLDEYRWSVIELSTKKVLAGPYEVRLQDFNWSSTSEGFYFTKWASIEESAKNNFYAHNYFVDLKTKETEIAFIPPQKNAREFYGIEEFQNANGETNLVAFRVQGPAEVPLAYYIGLKGAANQALGEFQVGQYKWKPVQSNNNLILGKFLAARNGKLYVRTSQSGNNFGIIEVDPITLKKRKIVPAYRNKVLLVAQIFGDRIYTQYLNHKRLENEIRIFDLQGQLLKTFQMSEVQTSNQGTLTAFMGSHTSPSVQFTYADIPQAPVTIVIDVKSLEFKRLASPEVNFNSSKVEYSLQYVLSEDGTKIPLKIYKRKDQAKPKFVYLYYYGFIGTAQQPQWNKKFQAMLDLGGSVAIVSPRGGGDYGRDWQLSVKSNRRPEMLDIVAAAKELDRQNPGIHIHASGRSFGGLMTAMLSVFYPQYFGSFSSVVPVIDTNEFLNRGLFGAFALADFGVPTDRNGNALDTPEFRDLINSWSALWNLATLKAPKPIVFFSGQNDQRVGPEQARFMYQALLNQFPNQQNLFYLFEEPLNGHLGRSEFNQEAAWIAKTLGLKAVDYKPLRR